MKKTQSPEPEDPTPDDILPEYDFDYSKARPNRFAEYHDDESSATA